MLPAMRQQFVDSATVTATAANKADVEQVADLLHGKEDAVRADSGHGGAQVRAVLATWRNA